jgi:tetratricopeptide (TPR) repeat protein
MKNINLILICFIVLITSKISISQTAEEYFNRGNQEFNSWQYQKAVEDYTKSIELQLDKMQAYVNRGRAYSRLEQYDKAISDYKKALELQPDFVEVYNYLGIAYYRIEEYDKAILEFNKALQLDPKNGQAYLNRGDMEYFKDNVADACLDWSKALELGKREAKEKMLKNCKLSKDDSARINTKTAEDYYNSGYFKSGFGSPEDAIADLTKAIEMNPNYTDAYNCRGFAYNRLLLFNEALKDFTKAIELDPGLSDAYLNRGVAYKNLGKYDEACADWYKAKEIGAPYAQMQIDEFCSPKEKKEEIKTGQTAEEFYNLGYKEYQSGQYEKAISYFSKAIELDPNLSKAYCNRGYSEYLSDKKTEACADWNKALELGYTEAKSMLEKYCK